MKDKSRLLNSAADDKEQDFAGVLALQRKLSTIERDLAAIQVCVYDRLGLSCLFVKWGILSL